MDKKEANAKHFARRLKEKLGWELTKEMTDQMYKSIRPDSLVRKLSKTRSLYAVYVRGTHLRVVYDEVRKSIITAWPYKK